jgi:hypothetical protein
VGRLRALLLFRLSLIHTNRASEQPIIWACSEGGNVITVTSESIAYGVLDLLTKIIWVGLVLYLVEGLDNIERLGLVLSFFLPFPSFLTSPSLFLVLTFFLSIDFRQIFRIRLPWHPRHRRRPAPPSDVLFPPLSHQQRQRRWWWRSFRFSLHP